MFRIQLTIKLSKSRLAYLEFSEYLAKHQLLMLA